MNAKDLYADVLRELDRYQAPSFEVHEYNYFLPKAVNQVLVDAYRAYKDTGKPSDVLRFYSLSVTKSLNPKLSDKANEVSLTLDDRYILSVKGTFKAIKDDCGFKQGDTSEFYLNETEEKRLRDLFRNSYLIPNLEEDRAYWLIEGRKLKVLYTSSPRPHANWQVSKLDYVAVKEPDLSSFLLPANFMTASLPTIQVPDKLIKLFVNKTVDMFLENSMNPRLSTHTTINQ
jgi:hypothetical protein